MTKQQMQWTLKGAHLLLQIRTKVLNDELEEAIPTLVSAISRQGEGRSLTPDFVMRPRGPRTGDSTY